MRLGFNFARRARWGSKLGSGIRTWSGINAWNRWVLEVGRQGVAVTKKRLPKESLNLRGAAYRIRTYDALIRSQVLYPAEVTPRAIINNACPSAIRQGGIPNL